MAKKVYKPNVAGSRHRTIAKTSIETAQSAPLVPEKSVAQKTEPKPGCSVKLPSTEKQDLVALPIKKSAVVDTKKTKGKTL